jgi:hypothetical protein
MPLFWTLLLNGPLGLAGYWSARHVFRLPSGLPRGLAAVTLAWTWATLGMEVLGFAGFLTYGVLLGWTAAGLAIASLFWLRRHDSAVDADPAAPKAGRAWEWEAVVAVALVLWTAAVHGLSSLLGPVKVISDAPIYHLYFAARWWKAGQIFVVPAPFGESVVSYFPAVGDVWFTWLLVGWGGDRLAKVGQVPFLVVAALAAAGSARRLGAQISAAVIAAACFAAIFPFLLFGLEANVDAIFVAAYLVAAYFFVRYALGEEPTASLVVGGLASGGVLGTKPTGIVFGGLLLVAAAVGVWVRRSSLRQAAGHLALLGLLPLVMAGAWYGQNAWLTGNPLYPLHLKLLGRVWLAGWYGTEAMRLSPYYIPMSDWRALVDILLSVFDPRLAPLWAAALAGAWALGRRSSALDWLVWAFTALAVANLAAYWILVPYRTQQRFMFQAAGLLVVPLARLLERGRWLRVLAVGLVAVHLATPQSWPFGGSQMEPPWDLTRLIPNAVPPLLSLPYLDRLGRGQVPGPDDVSSTLAILAIGAGALAVGWLWSRPGRRAAIRAVAGSLVVAAGTIAVAYPSQADPRALFFPPFPQYFRGWLQLDGFAGPRGARVAYAGTNLPYYLLGVGLRNDVRYVNVDRRPGWLLHDYHGEARRQAEPTWPNPWPTWDRVHADYGDWLANLRRERIDLLVVASMGRPRGALPDADRAGFPIERRWAEAHPESFAPLYGVNEHDPSFRIFQVRPLTSSFKDVTESGRRHHYLR